MNKTIEKYSNIVKDIGRNTENITRFENKLVKQYMTETLLKPIFLKEDKFISELKNLLTVMDIEGVGYVRVGGDADGGYVMINNFDKVSKIYSVGIGEDISFDTYFSDKEKDVFMYDHTISDIQIHNSFLHWFKIGLCGGISSNNMKTLQAIIKENGDEDNNNMILKMDIEGYEWDVFKEIDSEILDHFDQIVLELHGMHDLTNKDVILKSLKNLNRTHQLVHVHGNNGGTAINIGDWNLPDLLEVTYANRRNYSFVKSQRFFPTVLDKKNFESLPDIPLGYYN